MSRRPVGRASVGRQPSRRARGVLLVISGPSGVGKSTLCRKLLGRVQGLTFSVSFTTRAPRPGEKDGVDYHFVDELEFRRLRKERRFLEWARVDGKLYGTSRDHAEAALRRGSDLLLDIDTQGAEQVRRRAPDAVLVFVLPPRVGSLRERHRNRGTDPAVRERRLRLARREVLRSKRYDYLVFNDTIDRATEDLKGIVLAERCRLKRQLPRAAATLKAFRNSASR